MRQIAASLTLIAVIVALAVAAQVSAQDPESDYRLPGLYVAAFPEAGIAVSALRGDWCASVSEPTNTGGYLVRCWTLDPSDGFPATADRTIDTMTTAEVVALATAQDEPAFVAVNPPYLHAGYAGRYAATVHGLGASDHATATRACVQVQGEDVGGVAWDPARTRVVPFSIGDTRAAALTAGSVQVATVGVSLHAGACTTSALTSWTYSLPLAG